MRKLPRLPAAVFRMRKHAPLPRDPRSILVVRTDDIGDLMLTVPLIQTLRGAYPSARLTLVAAPGPARLVDGTGLVDDVVPWKPLARGRFTLLGQTRTWWFARRELGSPDLAVLPRVDYDMTGERYLTTGARAVVGFDPRSRPFVAREKNETSLLTHPIKVDDLTRHQLAHDQDLRQALGLPTADRELSASGKLLLGAEDRSRCDALLGEDIQPLVALALGAGHPKRRWPAAYFARVISAAHEKHGVCVALIGAPGDREIANEFLARVAKDVPVVDTIGRAELRTSLALLDRADAYLGGDTGPMHLASSVGTPAVVVSCHPRTGSPLSANAPNRFGPWSPDSVVLQPDVPAPGCHDECRGTAAHCILGVDVAAVETALGEHLDRLRTEVSP